MSYEQEKQVAIEAAAAAAKLCEQVRRERGADAMEKRDRSPVTVADLGAQAVICQALFQAFPNDSVVAEEDAAMLREPAAAERLTQVTTYVQVMVPEATPEAVTQWIDRGNGTVGSRYWTLDPIDGTKGFIRGDQYAVALALVEDGEVKVGALACPALPVNPQSEEERGVLFVAVKGEGTKMLPLNGGTPSPVQVVSLDDTANLRMLESVEAAHGDHSLQEAIAQAVGITTPSLRMDSQAKYGAVARGQAALYLRLPSPKSPNYRENIWDHAAGAIVVEEAGGQVTDMHGQPLDFTIGPKLVNNQGVIVSNGVIHATVLEALREKVTA